MRITADPWPQQTRGQGEPSFLAPPSFALEFASDCTHRREHQQKPRIYPEVGAGSYWRFDPTGGDLHAPILQGDRSRPPASALGSMCSIPKLKGLIV